MEIFLAIVVGILVLVGILFFLVFWEFMVPIFLILVAAYGIGMSVLYPEPQPTVSPSPTVDESPISL